MFHKALCCAVLAAFLAGCVSDVRPGVLPPIVSYSEAFQRAAAQEIERLDDPCERQVVDFGNCSAVHRLVIDYLLMRDQVRAAN